MKLSRICAALAGLAIVCAAQSPNGFVVPYPPAPASTPSQVYTVTVNGQAVYVHRRNEIAYAHFAFAGRADIAIQVSGNTNPSFNLSPQSYALAAAVSSGAIRFTLSAPRKLLLRVNGASEELCIFAEAPEDTVPSLSDSRVRSILSYAIDTTGATDATQTIQEAIDNLPSGNTLVFPRGTYQFTRIRFRSNRDYYFAPGACLSGSTSTEPQISFNNCENVRVYGRGTFDGGGHIHRANNGGAESGTTFLRVDPDAHSTNVLLEGIVVRNFMIWGAILFDTHDWVIRNVKMISDSIYGNRDGIDPHNAVNMLMDEMFWHTSDDNIAFCSTRNAGRNNVTVRNSVFSCNKLGSCIKLGIYVDQLGGFLAENCDFIQTSRNDRALTIYAAGPVRDVLLRGIRVEQVRYGLVGFHTRWTWGSGGAGSIDNVLLQNVSAASTGHAGSHLEAVDTVNFIRNVTFDNVTIGATTVASASQAAMTVGAGVSALQFTTSAQTTVDVSSSMPVSRYNANASFVISRAGPQTTPLTVRFSLRGTARAGADYQALDSSVTIAAGSVSSDLEIRALRQTYSGGWRSLTLTLEHDSSRAYIVGPQYNAQVALADALTQSVSTSGAVAPVATRTPHTRWTLDGRRVPAGERVASTCEILRGRTGPTTVRTLPR